MMQQSLDKRLLVGIAVLLSLPVLPLVGGVSYWERLFLGMLQKAMPDGWLAGTVFLLLMSDMLLPVPSSVVMSLSGARLGWLAGSLVNWAGLTAGAVVVFAAVRCVGRYALGRWLPAEQELRWQTAARRWGPWWLVATRAVPLVAEVAVVVAAIHQMPWTGFLLAMTSSNAVLAVLYGLLGHVAAQHQWLISALFASAVLPMLLTAWLYRSRQSRASTC